MKNRIDFMNIQIDNLTMSEAIDHINELIIKKEKTFCVTPNVDGIVKLQYDEHLQTVYKNAGLILADGKPLLRMSKNLGSPIKEKVSGSDLFPRLCDLCSSKKYTMFFLGAAEGVAKKAAENLQIKYPHLNVVGCFSPSYGFENSHELIEEIINRINIVKPDVLIVGLGCPKQEYFINDYIERLDIKMAFALGASLDFEAGKIKRAPIWMQRCGLEWFYRFLREPKRMFRRYFVDDMKIIKIYKQYKNGRKIENDY